MKNRKYIYELSASMLLYALTVLASITFLKSNPDHNLNVLISLLPVAPSILVVIAIFRYLKKLDEMQQRIQLFSFATSFVIVGLSTFAYGFLENIGFPHIPYVWVFPFMVVTWGLITPAIARTFR